ncbi:MAG: DUF4412 domain-containing protein [Verrucomicrobia bacterium]|nr:DUF4412 domain-containing protein [Verrucomicrobiota bacterium]
MKSLLLSTVKNYLPALAAVLLLAGLVPAQAQFGSGGGGGPQGPRLGGGMVKVFGENSAFSATMLMQANDPSTGEVTVPGKLAFDGGKSRFEMDITQMKGGRMPPGAAEQVKAMGMGEMVVIARPDKKASYLIYPGLQAYADVPLKGGDAADPNDFKMESTELGKETVDGHPCVKNKVIITDKESNKHEMTVWNATDLKKFPVKIETNEQGKKAVMTFKDIKLAKPDAGQFEPPSGATRYDNPQAMMQDVMMKRFGGGAGGFPKK